MTGRPPRRNTARYLRMVICKMIERLEKAVEESFRIDSAAKARRWEKTHSKLFGEKGSLAATAASLSELVLELEERVVDERQEKAAEALSPADVALVQAFVMRMRRFKDVAK